VETGEYKHTQSKRKEKKKKNDVATGILTHNHAWKEFFPTTAKEKTEAVSQRLRGWDSRKKKGQQTGERFSRRIAKKK